MKGNINIYCDESTHLPNDGFPFLVVGATVCPVDQSSSISKRLAEIKLKHQLPKNFEIKWVKVSPAKIDFYFDIIDYFFDDDDIEFRAVIAKKNSHHNSERISHDDWYYETMFQLVKNVVSSNGASYIYIDKKDTKGGAKIEKLHEVIATDQLDFDRRRVQRLQIVESHHVGLLQLADLLLGAVNYANRELNSSSAKMALVARIRERSGVNLTQTTLLTETKLNLYRWGS